MASSTAEAKRQRRGGGLLLFFAMAVVALWCFSSPSEDGAGHGVPGGPAGAFVVPAGAAHLRRSTRTTGAARTMHRGCRVSARSAASAPLAGAVLASRPARAGMPARYKVTIDNREDGTTTSFECPDDVYILDQAEEEDIELPYSCRAGSCSACSGRLKSGSLDQTDQAFLDDSQVDDGYCLLCVSYPTSDVHIQSHCEDELQ